MSTTTKVLLGIALAAVVFYVLEQRSYAQPFYPQPAGTAGTAGTTGPQSEARSGLKHF